MPLTLDDFDYTLPPALIAQEPPVQRSASRLLVLAGAHLRDSHIRRLPDELRQGDLLVFNDSRVIHARLLGHKASGGRVEVLVERPLAERDVLAQVRASHAPPAGSRLTLGDGLVVEVLGRQDGFYVLRFPAGADWLAQVEAHGLLPLPPYIERPATRADEARYQTVYARAPGSVAAPTAGLHFDEALLESVRAAGAQVAWVTLHVGAGTFQPVRETDLSRHHMHCERYFVPQDTVQAVAQARAAGGRVIAVGTTSLRTLEAASGEAGLRAGGGETDLFIIPGYRFRCVDALLTNFHLPRSTLLMLVSAFAGLAPTRAAYAHAVAAGYRFFSYGDAMFIPQRLPCDSNS